MDVKRNKIYKMKYYSHFDEKVHWKNIKNIVENPEMVAKHGFFPFIHYTQNIVKFNKKVGRKPPKSREIFYSSHIDRYIYQLYAYKLNSIYNKRVIKDCTNKCVIAYRNNLHKCNIHFAKKVFDEIRKHEQAYIIIGDFTSFFDSLDHSYLKDRLCNLLETNKLPDDYYAIFKNITKFSYIELKKLQEINRLTYRELNKQNRVLEIKDFRKYKKECLKKNKNNYGIPQGSAISAVLSNIYMLDFDKKINDFITSKKGIYMRYSDDFVIVLPKCEVIEFQEMCGSIYSIIESVKNLKLQPEKTQVFEYENLQVKSCNRLLFSAIPNGKNIINYLGFSFDGKVVTIRDKTISNSKYYYRMYRKIDVITKRGGESKKGNKIPMDKLYKKYSFYGEVPTKNNRGNFLTYVNRAKKVFGPNEAIDRSTKKHWGKLQKRLHKSWK